MQKALIPLALTLGEPAGIGPDLTLQLFANRVKKPLPCFAVFGDVQFLGARAARLKLEIAVRQIDTLEQAADVFDTALPVMPLAARATDVPGFLDKENAAIVTASIEQAVGAVRAKQARAVVTAPIHKANLYEAGFKYPGHTEFLAALCAQEGVSPRPVMMLAHKDKRAIPVTIHIALKEVFSRLTVGRIVETVRVAHHDLIHKFGIAAPRIGVTGLNPHAGEDGFLTICEGETTDTQGLFDALQGDPEFGGTWTPMMGGMGTYNYIVSPTAPCMQNDTAMVVVDEQLKPDAEA